MSKSMKKNHGNWIFLAVAVALWCIVGIFRPAIFVGTFNMFWEMIQRILPFLAGVLFLMFLFNLFFDAKRVSKYLGRGSGLKGWLLMIGFGIISMGASYLWYPLLSDLKAKGVSNALLATFLYNRAIKIQLLPFLIYYFGWPFTLVMTVYMILFSVLSGLLVEKLVSPKVKS